MKKSDYIKINDIITYFCDTSLVSFDRHQEIKKIICNALIQEIKKIELYKIPLKCVDNINFFKTDNNNLFIDATDFILNRFLNNCVKINLEYPTINSIYNKDGSENSTVAQYLYSKREIIFFKEYYNQQFCEALTHEINHSLEYNCELIPLYLKDYYTKLLLDLRTLNNHKYTNQFNNNINDSINQNIINDFNKINNLEKYENNLPLDMNLNEGFTEMYTNNNLNLKKKYIISISDTEFYKPCTQNINFYCLNESYASILSIIVTENIIYQSKYINTQIFTNEIETKCVPALNVLKNGLFQIENSNQLQNINVQILKNNLDYNLTVDLANNVSSHNFLRIVDYIIKNSNSINKLIKILYNENTEDLKIILISYIKLLDYVLTIMFVESNKNELENNKIDIKTINAYIDNMKDNLLQYKNSDILDDIPALLLLDKFNNDINKINNKKLIIK